MGITEELNELNKRVVVLNKKQEELKRLLAVEEHKVGELSTSLQTAGYDVEKMSIDDLNVLLEKLTSSLSEAKVKLEGNIKKTEDLYAKFDEMK